MIRLLALLLLLLPRGAGAGGDFESGCTAFDQGDYQGARELWEPLAADGDAQAQFRLGCLYTFGQGVPEDHEAAVKLFRLAAEQGDADAQNNLGGMYAEGLGVEVDLVEAYSWFELAAATGHETAARNRDFVAALMSEAQVDDALARAEARSTGLE